MLPNLLISFCMLLNADSYQTRRIVDIIVRNHPREQLLLAKMVFQEPEIHRRLEIHSRNKKIEGVKLVWNVNLKKLNTSREEYLKKINDNMPIFDNEIKDTSETSLTTDLYHDERDDWIQVFQRNHWLITVRVPINNPALSYTTYQYATNIIFYNLRYPDNEE